MTRGRVLVAGLVGVGAAAFAGGAGGTGLRGVADGWLVPPATVSDLLDAGTVDTGESPGRGIWAAAGQTKLWGLPDLPVAELAAGAGVPLAGGVVACGGAWQTTGAGALRITRLAGWIGWRGDWTLSLQAAREARRVGAETVQEPAEFALAGGPDLRLAGRTRLRLQVYVTLTKVPAPRAPVPLGRLDVGQGGAALAVALARRPGRPPTLGGEVCAAADARVAFGVRFDGASGSLGPALAIRAGPILLRTSHITHPVLGVTHRLQLVAGAGAAVGP